MNDPITNPMHYDGAHGIECKEAMENMVDRCLIGSTMRMTHSMTYWWGCALKYLWRFPFKNGVQDIDKCIECLTNIRRAATKSVIDNGEL